MKKLAVLLLLLASVGDCKDRVSSLTNYERRYHSLVPLGAERIDLDGAKRALFLMATAESTYFEGWHSPVDAHDLFSADGQKVGWYPQQLAFRLTATAMRPDLLEIDSYGTLRMPESAINDYLLHLGFRVLVFHGLQVTPVEPEHVELIGMPANIPYGERIYHINFDLPHRIPLEDRIVLEVLSPTGYRICKFHLDLV